MDARRLAIGSDKWTPLVAVADSHRAPQPKRKAENTIAGLDAARAKQKAIAPKVIFKRDKLRIQIAKMLIGAKSDLDMDPGHWRVVRALGNCVLLVNGYKSCDRCCELLSAENKRASAIQRLTNGETVQPRECFW